MTGEEKRALFKRLAQQHGLKVTSEHRPGARTRTGRVSDHAHNRALDVSGPPDRMAAFAETLASRHGGAVKELIYSPKGHYENGRWAKTGDKDHHNHVHVAWHGDDGGGMDLTRFPAPGAKAASLTDFPAPKAATSGSLTDFPVPKQQKHVTLSSKPKGDGGLGAALSSLSGAYQSAIRPPVAVKVGSKVVDPRAVKGASPKEIAQAQQMQAAGFSPEGGVRGAVKTTLGATQKGLNVAGAPLYPVRDLLNAFGDELGRISAKRGRVENVSDAEMGQAILNAVKRWKPWQSFKQGVMEGKATDAEFFQRWAKGDHALRERVKKIGGPAMTDFLASFPIDAISGKAWGAGVGVALKATERPRQAAQAMAEAKIPKLGRIMEDRRGYIASREVMNRHSAFFDQYLRAGEDIAEDVRRTSQRYMKQTRGKIRETDALTGKTKNVFDELIADYMDAGNPGSKYADIHQAAPGTKALGAGNPQAVAKTAPLRGRSLNFRRELELEEVRKRAAMYGVDFEDVQRIGDRYLGVFDELGQHLVNYKLLSPEAYASLKGQYLPRLYLLTHGNPGDVRAYLEFLEKSDLIAPDALRFALDRLQERTGRLPFGKMRGPKQFRQGREINNWEASNDPAKARALIPEATPAALHGIAVQSRAAGEAAGHAEIALNPMLALSAKGRKVASAVDPQAVSTTALARVGQQPKALPGKGGGAVANGSAAVRNEIPRHWVKWEGSGPLKDHYVHPGVARLLKFHSDPGMTYKWIREQWGPERAQQYLDLSNFIKRVWVSHPKTALNNIVGTYSMGESTAAIHSAKFSLAGYGQAIAETRGAGRGGAIAPLLSEALLETSILRQSGLQVPSSAKKVGSGFGVETAAERLKQKPSEWFQAYGKTVYNDPELAGRYYLYKELRQSGKSVREAERIVNDAMVTYTDVGPIVRELERNPLFGAPFITFPLKATFTAARVAALRPDKLHSYTGERLRDFLDSLADEKAGGQGVAKRKRQAGEVGPFDFPIPGARPGGKQLYTRAPLLAPFAGIVGSNRGGPLTENVGERLRSMNPLLNLVQTLYFNENEFTGYPIVPLGSIPGMKGNLSDVFGSSEAAWKYTGAVMKAIFPEYADLERTYHAVTGTPEYDSLSAPVPRFKATMLRALTGVNLQQGVGENPEEKAFRVAERIEKAKPDEYRDFAFGYTQQLLEQRNTQGAAWTPNARLQGIADQYDPKKLHEAIQNAGDRLVFVLLRDTAKGDERKRKVREMMDWIYALSLASEKHAVSQSFSLTPEQRAPFAGILGAP